MLRDSPSPSLAGFLGEFPAQEESTPSNDRPCVLKIPRTGQRSEFHSMNSWRNRQALILLIQKLFPLIKLINTRTQCHLIPVRTNRIIRIGWRAIDCGILSPFFPRCVIVFERKKFGHKDRFFFATKYQTKIKSLKEWIGNAHFFDIPVCC